MKKNTYWLSRDGTDTEGPYAPERIRQMWQVGDITQDAQVTSDGSEEWKPVSTWLAEHKAPAAGKITTLCLLLLPLSVVALLAFEMVREPSEVTHTASEGIERTRTPGKPGEVRMVSLLMELRDREVDEVDDERDAEALIREVQRIDGDIDAAIEANGWQRHPAGEKVASLARAVSRLVEDADRFFIQTESREEWKTEIVAKQQEDIQTEARQLIEILLHYR